MLNFKENEITPLIKFILNNKEITTNQPAGMLLVDFIRYHQHLTGTKIGCNEGDCGACTVLIGRLVDDAMQYRSFTSCLTPIGNIHGKHVVTIEGINVKELTLVQQAMHRESATQCGFCTPGFVVSLTGFCLGKETTEKHAMAAIDGNICRCTGYKSIQRAAGQVAEAVSRRGNDDPIDFAVANHILPPWFSDIKPRLRALMLVSNGHSNHDNGKTVIVGGGTDLYVQKHDEMSHAHIHFLLDQSHLKGIERVGNLCELGPSVTVTDLVESPVIREYFSQFGDFSKLISSTQIRNMATLGGNFVNASPIGDFTIFFLALNATLVLNNKGNRRELPLRKFYKGYKTLDKGQDEHIEKIKFELPSKNSLFNFEKVSKRTNLDIASVNSAMHLVMDGKVITTAGISAGGVAPIPAFLEKTSAFLAGKQVTDQVIREAINIAQTEVSPISDPRGQADYKRLLLSQLIRAHFLTLFPELKPEKIL